MSIKIVQNTVFKKSEDIIKRLRDRNSSFDRIMSDGIYFINDIYDVMDREDNFDVETDDDIVTEHIPVQLYNGYNEKVHLSHTRFTEPRRFGQPQVNTPMWKKYRLLDMRHDFEDDE